MPSRCAASCPQSGTAAPLRLIWRDGHNGVVRPVYRVGVQGDMRTPLVAMDAKGKLSNLAVKADPDNR